MRMKCVGWTVGVSKSIISPMTGWGQGITTRYRLGAPVPIEHQLTPQDGSFNFAVFCSRTVWRLVSYHDWRHEFHGARIRSSLCIP